jgi:Xaa-Pro aminopeptidase
MFARDIYIQRRKKLRKSVGKGLILLLGNDESPMNYADNGYHFRQDSTFLYFFGLDHPYLPGYWIVKQGRTKYSGTILQLKILFGWGLNRQ